jgi:hypothetical protein
LLELSVVALLVLRIFVSVLASENFLSKSLLSTPVSLKTNFARILLLSTALVISINTIAGGRSSERNLMDDFLQGKTSANSSYLLLRYWYYESL